MLPYTEVKAAGLEQPYASRQLRLAEELNFVWTGELSVMPFTDNFFETQQDPNLAVVYNDDQGADNWKALREAWNSEVAPLNQKWIGTSTQTAIVAGTNQTTQVGQNNVTTALQETTREAYYQLASGNQSTASTQDVKFDRVVQVEAALFMRQREFVIQGRGLKNNSRVYAFFDGINVTANCYQIELIGASTTLQTLNSKFAANTTTGLIELGGVGVTHNIIADGANTSQQFIVKNNQIYLLFEVPSTKFYTGQREFKITDSPTNSEGTTLTSARNNIYAQGIISKSGTVTINSRPYNVSFNNTEVIRPLGRKVVSQQRVETASVPIPQPPPRSTDPLSQSFYVDPDTYPKGFYLTSIDLFFKAKSQDNNRNVTVEIRELENGYPSPQFVSDGDIALVNNRDINVSNNASSATKFTFKNPIYLNAGNDYCFAVKPENNDPDFAIWVAELGAIDITNPDRQTRIEQAYNSGLLFTSSTDRTWTAKQNTDMKFTMRVAEFDTSAKFAYWTNISVPTAFTYDALTPAISDQILPGTNISYDIKTADSTFAVDSDYTTVKNYERLVLRSRKQISTTASETANAFKSLQVRATLSTTNKFITPYIDDENIIFHFDKNVINNLDSTAITGTVTYGSSNNIVVGSGTSFTTQVFPGEYAYFGDEYRRIASVSNNVYLTVTNNFTTANAVSQAMTIRNEENPTGPYSSESRYITKVVTLNDGFEASDLVTYLRVNRPPGTSIKVYAKLLNENDADKFDDKFYTPMELVGTETFTLNQNEYKEEKYVVPSVAKTGGSELLVGTVAISNVSTTVTGTSTRFIEDLKIGDTIAVGTARTERVVATIANNVSLTVESVFSTLSSTQDVFRVLNNAVAYTTPDGRTFQGYKYFAIKIVFLSSNPSYAPKVKDLRGIALA
jgi:hypothetical protein